ncbi:MAG: ribbon-helix-helix protein, CopG family [Archaeoglobus sp.]|nr:ribbon-helix-helix protein, CopG family [Archaeoglobus sp.]
MVAVKTSKGGYRGITLPARLVEEVERTIEKLGTYRSVADFVKEAVREKLERVRTAYSDIIDADALSVQVFDGQEQEGEA